MRVLILNASPKKKGSASKFFSTVLKCFLPGCERRTCALRGPMDYEACLEELAWADAVVISAPLYVDGAPGHVMEFLERAEIVCREKKLSFRLYALSNSGFIEGKQNALHLRIYEGFCRRAGITWGSGLGLGGGVMLYWMCILTPLFLGINTIKVIAHAMTQSLTLRDVWGYYSGAVITLLLCAGFFVCAGILGSSIRHGRSHRNMYTRVLVPSLLFLPVADLFMLISALCNGCLPHRMFRRVK